MFRALCIDYAMEGLKFLEAGNISFSKTFFYYQFFVSDPLLVNTTVEFPQIHTGLFENLKEIFLKNVYKLLYTEFDVS